MIPEEIDKHNDNIRKKLENDFYKDLEKISLDFEKEYLLKNNNGKNNNRRS